MDIENERKLFEEKFFNSEFVFSDAWCDEDDEYYDMYTQKMWEAWQASANREGFVLVPRYCTNKMAHAGKCIDGRLSAFKYGDVWDAMIEASQENKDE